MQVRYREFDSEAASAKALLERLRRIFNQLVLMTNGEVPEALDWLDTLARRHGLYGNQLDLEAFKQWLEDERGAIQTDLAGNTTLTRSGEGALRRESLDQVFSALGKDGAGDHRVAAPGEGTERLSETRPWAFGDPLSAVDPTTSLRNALRRTGAQMALGQGGALELSEDDLEVFETEHHSSCASVLLVDISHSMILYGEDRITPAKRVALALAELTRTRYPKDSLEVVTFGDDASVVPLDELPYLSVGPFHTNTRAGLRVAQDLLKKKRHANRQILMITDGKPSALTERNGTIYKNPFGLDRRIVAKTLEEADSCRRKGIQMTTFMLTDDPVLVEFVEDFTKVARGRAFFSNADSVGEFVFVDYIKNRRRRVR